MLNRAKFFLAGMCPRLYKRYKWYERVLRCKIFGEERFHRWWQEKSERINSMIFWEYMKKKEAEWDRELNDAEVVKLKKYEKEYDNIYVYFLDGNEAIGKFTVKYAMWMQENEESPSNACKIICVKEEGIQLSPNSFLMKKFTENFEIITKENFAFYYAYITRNKERVFARYTVYYTWKFYENSLKFIKTGIPSFPRYPSLIFTEEERILGANNLKQLGIQEPYICIFARESKYYREKFHIEFVDLRDSDINSFRKVTEYFAGKGIQTVRMGNCAEREYHCEGAIDYASIHPTPFMDAFLFSRCRFFITDCSGIFGFAHIFARPLAAINIDVVLFPLNWDLGLEFTLGIYEKFYDKKNKRYLRLRDIAAMEAAFHQRSTAFINYHEYVLSHYEVIKNTPEEILELAKEMEAIQQNTVQYSLHDEELQLRYRDLLAEMAHKNPQLSVIAFGRIGMQWLRDNEWFLE